MAGAVVRKAKRGELTREQVVAAALACLDRLGLDGFSVREVARDVGVFPTALYWHVPGGRNALLAEAAALALAGVVPDLAGTADWTGWLLDLFRRYRRALQLHPNAAPLLGAQLVSNAGIDPGMVEGILRALEAGGFEGPALREAYNAVLAAMVGFVTLELAPAPKEDAEAWAASLRGWVQRACDDAATYPVLARNASLLSGSAFVLRWESGATRPMDATFEAFAELVLRGLRDSPARVGRST